MNASISVPGFKNKNNIQSILSYNCLDRLEAVVHRRRSCVRESGDTGVIVCTIQYRGVRNVPFVLHLYIEMIEGGGQMT